MEAEQGVVFISIPTILDPSLAPTGNHILHAFTPSSMKFWEGLSPLDIAGNYAPQPTVLVNTSAIAITSVVGVTVIGQPIAKFVQKQLKGQVKSFSKKITKKLLAIRGKKPPVKSLAERKKEQRDSRK